MRHHSALHHTTFNPRFLSWAQLAKFAAVLVCALQVCGYGYAQTLSTYAGLNTTVKGENPTATPDPTIAVGTLEYCEHVNSAYQCWYKGGANANQPVDFLGGTSPKSDAGPWSQNSNNSGNTPNCPTAFSPNSQMLHDNVYNLWILEKRITSKLNGDNYMCVAISNVEDVSSASFAWFAFEYNLDNVIPTNSHGNHYYPDYPQSGLWQSSTSNTPPYTPATDQAMWITYDLMDPNNGDAIVAVLVCAVDLAGLRASTSNPYVNNSLTPACALSSSITEFNTQRSWVPANNSDTIPPIDADGEMFTYMIEPAKGGTTYLTSATATQGVQQWTINWSASTPTPTVLNTWDLPSTAYFLSGGLNDVGDQLGCFTLTSYYDTVCVPQPSTATTGIYIDSVADRMQQFFHYTSNGGTASTWTCAHAIQINPSTVLSQTEADIRILERQASAPNAVYLYADYPVLDPVDPNAYVVLPSIARDQAGNLQGILGISGSGSNEHPGLDTITLVPGTPPEEGTWGYVANPNTDGDAEDTDSLNYRWGDWYSAVLDPSDSCTVWVAGEYLPVNRTTEPYWYTEIGKLPPMSTCGGPVTLSSLLLNFGDQQVGVQSNPIVETVTNNQTTALTISGISAGGGNYSQTNTCQQPVPAGGNCTISVYFTPSTSGTITGTLTITDSASTSPQTAALTGIGVTTPSLSVTPTTLSFGNQILGTSSAAQNISVTNSGSINATVNSIAASGGYSETDNCTGVNLAPNQSCTISVTFTPTVTGAISGAITVNDAAVGAPQVVGLTGTGLLPVSMSANLTFPATNVGATSASETMTVSNNQSSTLNYTYAITGNFSAVGSGSTPCNGTLAAASKCTFAVSFTPTADGVIKGSLAITPTGANAPIAAAGMTGTGQNGAASPLTFSPANLTFGNVGLATTASKTVSIKNASSSALTINSVTTDGYFSVTPSGSSPCGGTLNAGASCTVTATFSPLVAGTIVGGITVVDSASVGTQIQDATGTGVLDVSLSPTSISFGTVAVGSTSTVSVVTVSNNLTAAVAINSVVASGDFISTTGGGVPCGSSIPANSSCTLGVEFAPTVSGTIDGALTVSYGAGSSPQTVALSGTGSTSNTKSEARKTVKGVK